MSTRHERRQVYIAEFHPHTEGDVWLRARCSICRPRWSGPWRRLADLIGNGRAMNAGHIEATLRDAARRDCLEHADRLHDGRLWA